MAAASGTVGGGLSPATRDELHNDKGGAARTFCE
jgi:hypothetical protein